SRFIPHHEEIHAVLHKFLGAFIQLYPELKEAEIALYLQVGAATIVWTADELNRLKVDSPQQVARREDKEAFIRRAFTTLRAIKVLHPRDIYPRLHTKTVGVGGIVVQRALSRQC